MPHLRTLLLPAAVLAAVLLSPACDDGDDGGFPGAGDRRLLVATRGPDALELLDAQTFDRALDSPKALPEAPVEARAGEGLGIFVAGLTAAPSQAFDSDVFQEEPDGAMDAAGRVAFDAVRERIYIANSSLAFFDAGDFSPLGFPPIDLGGEASDVLADSATGRVFVAVTTAGGPVLRVFGGDDLAEVPPSPIDLPGGGGVRTGDLLLVAERGELLILLPDASQLAGVDPASLRELPRTPVDLRIPAAQLARDPVRERIYAAAPDGRLEAVSATSFSLEGGFPRAIGSSAADLAFDPETQRLFVADSAAGEVVALDALTLEDEPDSPIGVTGSPVSVEVLDREEP